MQQNPVILAGLGFTTTRLASRLLVRGIPVFAAVRNPERFRALTSLGVRITGFEPGELPSGATVVNTIPPLPEPETNAIRQFIQALRPRRVVYISSTSVYGACTVVTAETPVDASLEKGRARIEEERWSVAGNWSSLILRPAGIYGPGRGVHVRVRDGRRLRGGGSEVVSRIHRDDLAALLELGAISSIEGAWPVADEYPCSSEEVASWCARLFRLEQNANAGEAASDALAASGRRVDGSSLRAQLGIELAYPGYQEGILASLAEEKGLNGPEADSERSR